MMDMNEILEQRRDKLVQDLQLVLALKRELEIGEDVAANDIDTFLRDNKIIETKFPLESEPYRKYLYCTKTRSYFIVNKMSFVKNDNGDLVLMVIGYMPVTISLQASDIYIPYVHLIQCDSDPMILFETYRLLNADQFEDFTI